VAALVVLELEDASGRESVVGIDESTHGKLCRELKSFGMKQIDASGVSIYTAQIISSSSR
jgi:hypothetical protein